MTIALTTRGRHTTTITAILAYKGTRREREALVMYRDGSTQWRCMRDIDVVGI